MLPRWVFLVGFWLCCLASAGWTFLFGVTKEWICLLWALVTIYFAWANSHAMKGRR